MHVQRVDAQVKGGEVHAVEDLHQGLAPALLHVDDLLGVLLHGPLYEAQQVLLVHAGRGVDVRVHLGKFKEATPSELDRTSNSTLCSEVTESKLLQ